MNKVGLLLLAFLPILAAQTSTPDDAVVMTVEGKNITAGDVRKILEGGTPQFLRAYQENALNALQQFFELRELASEAEAMKLDQKSPLKEQLENMRAEALFKARVVEETNAYPVNEKAIEEYYAAHRADFEVTKLKAIYLGFAPAPSAPGSSPEAMRELARQAVEAAHNGITRSEADAKSLAADLVRQLGAGADFASLVAKYSDDPTSKSHAGDFPPITQSSDTPAQVRAAVKSMKAGETSEPIRTARGFYVVRVMDKSIPPVNEVSGTIVLAIRQAHVQTWLASLGKQFTPVVKRPEFFAQRPR